MKGGIFWALSDIISPLPYKIGAIFSIYGTEEKVQEKIFVNFLDKSHAAWYVYNWPQVVGGKYRVGETRKIGAKSYLGP